jgi:tetratricopeptide (TPR) repeat protein
MPGALRARLLLSFGNLALVSGDPTTAAQALAEARETASRFEEALSAARAGAALAVALRYQGRPEAAHELLVAARDKLVVESIDSIEANGLRWALENEIGEVLDDLGRCAEAVQVWQECRRRAVAEDDPIQLAYPLINLARSALERGVVEEAQELVGRALIAATSVRSSPVLVDVVAVGGLVDLVAGRRGRAIARLRQAIRLGHAGGQLLSLPSAVALLAAAMVGVDPAVAVRLDAAARAWRIERSIHPVGRWTRTVISRAETELAGCPLAATVVEAEHEAGARTEFGSLRGLSMLDPGLLEVDRPADPAVIDLRPEVSRRR